MIKYTRVPHSIRIILTRKCNLQCSFCLADASNRDRKNELDTEEWFKFFKRIKELNVFNVSLSGGEIFLRADWFVLLKRLRDNCRHRITVFSNGTLITREVANRLRDIYIKFVSVSVDGLEAKHNAVRGKGNFQRTIKGIKNLLNHGIKPQVSFTPIRSNFKDMGPLIDFLVSLGISSIRVNTLTPEGRCINIYNGLALEFPLQIKEMLDVVEDKKKKHPGLKITCQLGFYYHLPATIKYFRENPPKEYKTKHLKDGCGAASTSCVITPTGDIIPCEGLSMFVGGNISERDFLDIWNDSGSLKKIRDLSKIAINQSPYCKNCEYNCLCDGGCRASAYLIYKDILAPDILCPYYKSGQVEEN